MIAQIPPPPINVPMPIRKALSTEGENITIHYLLHGEYELTNTSWSRLQQKYNISHNTMYTKEKEDPVVHNTSRKEKDQQNKRS